MVSLYPVVQVRTETIVRVGLGDAVDQLFTPGVSKVTEGFILLATY